MKNNKSRLSIEIDSTLRENARIKAVTEHTTLKELVTNFIKSYLKRG